MSAPDPFAVAQQSDPFASAPSVKQSDPFAHAPSVTHAATKATPRPADPFAVATKTPRVGALVFGTTGQQEFSKVTPQLREFAPAIAQAFGGVTVTSVESGPHKGSAHREGRALDVVPSFPIADNAQTRSAVARLISSGKLEALGTEAAIINDPELRQLAAQHNVDLFEDDARTGATGPHFHVQVPSAGAAEARFRGQSSIFREPLGAYGNRPQEPRPAFGATAPPSILDRLAQFGRSAQRVTADAVNIPLTGLNAVLGAPQRAVAGAIAKYPHNLQEATTEFAQDANAATGGGLPGPELSAAAYGVFHPNDPRVQQAAQQRTGWNRLHFNTPPQGLEPIHRAMLGFAATATNPTEAGMGLVGGAVTDPKNIRKVANAISDMGFQTVTDPLTYLGGAGVIRKAVAAPLEKFASYLGARGLTSQNEYVRNMLATFIPHPTERVALFPKGQAAVVNIRNAENGAYSQRAHLYEQLLNQHAAQIRTGQMPQEIEQELLRQSYRYGTPEMREESLTYGFQPNAEDLAFNGGQPQSVLNFHLKEDYFPHMRQYALPEPFREIGEAYHIPKPAAGFENVQEGEKVMDPLGSLTYRLASGNAAIRQRMLQARMARELGLPYRHPWADMLPEVDESRIDSHVRDTAKAYEILDNPLGPRTEEMKWLQPLSNVGRDTLIGANPVPHAKNISILATLAGGIPGFIRGLKYATTGVPETLQRRLIENGGATHFMLSEPAKFSPVRVLPAIWRKRVVQNSLDSIDMGMRAARLEQIDREYGSGLTEFEKMQKVNEDLGAYHDSPAYVNMLRQVGGQFPQWHGYIVPTAVGRAMLRDPQRVEAWIRAQDATNKNIVNGDQKQGYDIQFGGPITEMGEATNVPGQLATGQTATWLTSPSMIGPIGSAIAHGVSQPQSFTPDPNTSLTAQIIPYFNMVAPQFGINPYGSKAPPNVRTLAAFFGAYPKAEQSIREKMIRDFMERGLDRFKANQRVQHLFRMIRGR